MNRRLLSLCVPALVAVIGCGDADLRDRDQDGYIAKYDCNDEDSESSVVAYDGDCDGIPIEEDCDDADADSTSLLDDNDCDGVVTAEDCDDTDPELLSNVGDADCDGVPTEEDCDDNNPQSLSKSEDADCDGTRTQQDCDDNNPALNKVDADGDGNTTCDGDCDDNDPSIEAKDVDGDGYSTCDGDCDDRDQTLDGADRDGDGSSTCDGDCDDTDSSLNLDDADNDGVSTCEGDCDDANGSIVSCGYYYDFGSSDLSGLSSLEEFCGETYGYGDLYNDRSDIELSWVPSSTVASPSSITLYLNQGIACSGTVETTVQLNNTSVGTVTWNQGEYSCSCGISPSDYVTHTIEFSNLSSYRPNGRNNIKILMDNNYGGLSPESSWNDAFARIEVQ